MRKSRHLLRTVSQLAYCQRRNLSLHEYHCVDLLKQAGVTVPVSHVAGSAQEAEASARSIGGAGSVVKAQVLAGGRGMGSFPDSGLKGGVKLVSSAQEAKEVAEKMIGYRLVTKQTGTAGRPCHKVLVCERLNPMKEYYVAVIMDGRHNGPVIMASSQGGMSIEDVAKSNPDAIIYKSIDFTSGLHRETAFSVAHDLAFPVEYHEQFVEQLMKVYNVFCENDATMVEINPLSIDKNGKVYCMDAKITIDDNAAFRQSKIFERRDTSQEDAMEVEAADCNLSYIKLDGSIGCIVNGAGLAMATMDAIQAYGGTPANFLDLGGGADKAQVTTALSIISRDKNVKAILVNIFGGIIQCDIIAHGIVEAVGCVDGTIPIVVRLQGNKSEAAARLIANSDVSDRITFVEGFGTAAEKVAKLAN